MAARYHIGDLVRTTFEKAKPQRTMTIEDLAFYLKVTRRTIYDWLKHDKIPAVKLIGQWRFQRDKIDLWLESHAKPH